VTVGQKLVEIIPGVTPVEMVQARTEVKAAAYDKLVAERQYLRNKELNEQKLISPERYDRTIANYNTAKARFYAAMAQLRVLEQGSNVESLTEGIEISEEDRREIEKETREAIASMTLIAPISGIVLSRDTDKGSAVIPISSAYGGTEEEDIINFEIRATVGDQENKLRVGMSADAELILEEHENVLIIPEGAIIYEDGKTFVNIQDDSVEEGMRKVEIAKGISDGLRTEVLSGLEEGQVVVLPT